MSWHQMWVSVYLSLASLRYSATFGSRGKKPLEWDAKFSAFEKKSWKFCISIKNPTIGFSEIVLPGILKIRSSEFFSSNNDFQKSFFLELRCKIFSFFFQKLKILHLIPETFVHGRPIFHSHPKRSSVVTWPLFTRTLAFQNIWYIEHRTEIVSVRVKSVPMYLMEIRDHFPSGGSPHSTCFYLCNTDFTAKMYMPSPNTDWQMSV